MEDRNGGAGRTAVPAVRLWVGERAYDISHRALVMGILNRTTDSSTTAAPTSSWTTCCGGPSS